MNETGSQWRKELVKQAAGIYVANPHVDAIILGGSTARNHADKFSDIEIGVFWHQPPTDKERDEMARRTGGDVLRLYPYDEQEQVWSDDLMLGRKSIAEVNSGVLLEVAHYTNKFVEDTLEEVLVKHNADELKQNLISGILDGVPLKASNSLERWKTRAMNYPDGLAVAVVGRHAQIDHFWRWHMWLQRGPNMMMFYNSFVQIEEKILHMLLGLNRVYYFGFKWLDVVISRMSIKPSDLAHRLKEVYTLPPEDGAKSIVKLVDETYALIDQHMPEIDVRWLRRVFHYERPSWEQKPPVLNW